ncbi:hypothetical protein TRICI_005643 [Trichomonascus ciferrii]|uniref:Alpha-galactosidase n=1 Tax=Trichomonascus ciferrii TaxID=44093 RepID=A0A642UQX4_9ASCO|nr:hypothetical protein TRICI_005643 [Trichomonascus ciferrii]
MILKGGVVLCLAIGVVTGRETPFLGYNSYNDVGCSPNETHMRDTMNALVEKGFLDAGYQYFQVDCGWQGYERDENGAITYDKSVFPNGIEPLSKLAREKGFKWGMYTDQGEHSCDTRTDKLRQGSLGHEEADAAAFKSWNVDYVKVDNCYINGSSQDVNAPKDAREDFVERFGAMSKALDENDIPDMLVCQWGVPYKSPSGRLEGPYEWTKDISSAYRVTDDIADTWEHVMRIANQMIHVSCRGLSKSIADMDMLEVGNTGLTLAEQASHFALWALSKSSLFISTDIPSIDDQALAIALNQDLLAVNQDKLGKPVTLVQRWTDDWDLYSGPLENGDIVILAMDHSNTTRSLTVDLSKHLGIKSATIKNLWTGEKQKDLSSYTENSLQPHGSIVLRLSDIQQTDKHKTKLSWYNAEKATLSGNATTHACAKCSNKSKVSLAGKDATITFSDIPASSSHSTISFDYINTQIGYMVGDNNNTLNAAISVNSGPAQLVSFPLSGYDSNYDILQNYLVDLTGFNAGKDNSISISAVSSLPLEFDRIGVAL